jgi:SOUL heme-binding protein
MRNWRAILCVCLAMGATMSHAIEEPAWTRLTEIGDVEIRQYEPVIQARTPIGKSDKATGGFRTLANYIFGGNAREQEIAMTAPVEERLSDEGAYMAFTMPSQYSLDELPAPNGEMVTLHEVPA